MAEIGNSRGELPAQTQNSSAGMDEPSHKTGSVDSVPPAAPQIQQVQTSPTSTSSGTLYNREEGTLSWPPVSSSETSRQPYWKAIRSTIARYIGGESARDKTCDVEKQTCVQDGTSAQEDELAAGRPLKEEEPQMITRSRKALPLIRP